MALNRRPQLRNVVPLSELKINRKALRDLVSEIANRPVLLINGACVSNPLIKSGLVSLLLERVGGKDSALFIPPMDASSLLSAFEKIWTASGNLYPLLHRLGLLVISPAVIVDDGVLLSGGSYSNVLLRVKNGEALVYKKIQKFYEGENIDAGLRLRHEGEWLSALPEPAVDLFPRLRRLVDNDKELGYEMDFVPLGSVAELVFQDCIDGNQVFEVLREVYSALCTHMYCNPPLELDGLPSEKSYLGCIERRTKVILESSYPTDGILRSLYNAPWVEVNGVRCPSQFALLQQLRSDKKWRPVVEPSGNHLCHGDLILEDILVSMENPKEFRLVDPNAVNRCVLFDVAKTMLSLWIGYEFIYYDLFSIDECTVRSNGGIHVTITLDRPDCQSKYARVASLFVDFAQRELSKYMGLDARRFNSQLRMASALHALAIPMFHLLHHKRESAAFAFTCLGLYHASLALADCAI